MSETRKLTVIAMILTVLVGGQVSAITIEQDFFPPHPSDAQLWTGRLQGAKGSYSKHNNEIFVGKAGVNDWNGWIKIDLTGELSRTGYGLPVGAVVEEATLHYWVQQTPLPNPTNRVKLLANDPVPASAEGIWQDMASGAMLSENISHGTGWVLRSLNATGLEAVRIAAEQGWIAFGLYNSGGGRMNARGYNSAWNKPFLRLRYSVPSIDKPDLVLHSIDSPIGEYVIGAKTTPAVVVRNVGNVLVPHYTVTMVISDAAAERVYTATVEHQNIDVNESKTITLPELAVAGLDGNWTVIARVSAPDDVNPDNDQAEVSFLVNPAPEYIHWREVAPMPAIPDNRWNTVRRGSWLTYNEGNGLIYGAKGYRNEEFFSYDPEDRTYGAGRWTELSAPPLAHRMMRSGRWYRTGRPIERGARGVSDGNNSIYAMHGNMTNAFWRYDIAEDSWYSLDTIPPGSGRAGRRRFKGGGDLVYVENAEGAFVYLLKGERTEFVRYNVQGDSWEERADTPAGIRPRWLHGSWLAYDRDNTIYAHKARYIDRSLPRDEWRHELWAYDIAADTWHSEALHGMPLLGQTTRRLRRRISSDGGKGVFNDGKLWALKGGNTQMFYQYDPATNVWTELDTIPRRNSTGVTRYVGPGGHLVAYGDNGYLFALKGNRSVEFWRYSIEGEEIAGGAMGRPSVMAEEVPAGQPFLRIGPNPFRSGSATLQYQLPVSGSARLVIYDAVGRQRHEQRFNAQRRGALRTELGSLSAGVYLVRLEAADQELTTKLVIGR